MRRRSRHGNQQLRFMLTGFPHEEKCNLQKCITALEGVLCSEEGYDDKCSHIVCKKPSRSEKFLAGCATGKWLLTAKFITESYRHGRWLAEEDYEWQNTESMRACLNTDVHWMLEAPRRCRLLVQHGRRIFNRWRAAVIGTSEGKARVYRRLLELGGAHVEPLSLPLPSRSRFGDNILSLTHVFVGDKSNNIALSLLSANIPCLNPTYIGDSLLQETPPDIESYLVGPLGETTSNTSTPNTSMKPTESNPNRRSLVSTNQGSSTSSNQSTAYKSTGSKPNHGVLLNANVTTSNPFAASSSNERAREKTNLRPKAITNQTASNSSDQSTSNEPLILKTNRRFLANRNQTTRNPSNPSTANEGASTGSNRRSLPNTNDVITRKIATRGQNDVIVNGDSTQISQGNVKVITNTTSNMQVPAVGNKLSTTQAGTNSSTALNARDNISSKISRNQVMNSIQEQQKAAVTSTSQLTNKTPQPNAQAATNVSVKLTRRSLASLRAGKPGETSVNNQIMKGSSESIKFTEVNPKSDTKLASIQGTRSNPIDKIFNGGSDIDSQEDFETQDQISWNDKFAKSKEKEVKSKSNETTSAQSGNSSSLIGMRTRSSSFTSTNRRASSADNADNDALNFPLRTRRSMFNMNSQNSDSNLGASIQETTTAKRTRQSKLAGSSQQVKVAGSNPARGVTKNQCDASHVDNNGDKISHPPLNHTWSLESQEEWNEPESQDTEGNAKPSKLLIKTEAKVVLTDMAKKIGALQNNASIKILRTPFTDKIDVDEQIPKTPTQRNKLALRISAPGSRENPVVIGDTPPVLIQQTLSFQNSIPCTPVKLICTTPNLPDQPNRSEVCATPVNGNPAKRAIFSDDTSGKSKKGGKECLNPVATKTKATSAKLKRGASDSAEIQGPADKKPIQARTPGAEIQGPAGKKPIQARTPAKTRARGRRMQSKDSPQMQRFKQGTLDFFKVKKVEPSTTRTNTDVSLSTSQQNKTKSHCTRALFEENLEDPLSEPSSIKTDTRETKFSDTQSTISANGESKFIDSQSTISADYAVENSPEIPDSKLCLLNDVPTSQVFHKTRDSKTENRSKAEGRAIKVTSDMTGVRFVAKPGQTKAENDTYIDKISDCKPSPGNHDHTYIATEYRFVSRTRPTETDYRHGEEVHNEHSAAHIQSLDLQRKTIKAETRAELQSVVSLPSTSKAQVISQCVNPEFQKSRSETEAIVHVNKGSVIQKPLESLPESNSPEFMPTSNQTLSPSQKVNLSMLEETSPEKQTQPKRDLATVERQNPTSPTLKTPNEVIDDIIRSELLVNSSQDIPGSVTTISQVKPSQPNQQIDYKREKPTQSSESAETYASSVEAYASSMDSLPLPDLPVNSTLSESVSQSVESYLHSLPDLPTEDVQCSEKVSDNTDMSDNIDNVQYSEKVSDNTEVSDNAVNTKNNTEHNLKETDVTAKPTGVQSVIAQNHVTAEKPKAMVRPTGRRRVIIPTRDSQEFIPHEAGLGIPHSATISSDISRKRKASTIFGDFNDTKKFKTSCGLATVPWVMKYPGQQKYPLHQNNNKVPVAYPSPENLTNVLLGLLEDEFYAEALEMMETSLLNSTTYPHLRVVCLLINDILLTSTSESQSHRTHGLLRRMLAIHPPTTAALQDLYSVVMATHLRQENSSDDVMNEGYQNTWCSIAEIARRALDEKLEAIDMKNHQLLLRFYVEMLELDFRAFLNRVHIRKTGLHGNSCILTQLLWPKGSLATGQFNRSCAELIDFLLTAIKLKPNNGRPELTDCFQSLVAMATEICCYADLVYRTNGVGDYNHKSNHVSINAYRNSGKLMIFVKEIALNIPYSLNSDHIETLLTGIKHKWLTALVCEQILDSYSQGLLPHVIETDIPLTLRHIVSTHLFLLPPLTVQTCRSPLKKRRRKVNNEVENSSMESYESYESQHSDKIPLRESGNLNESYFSNPVTMETKPPADMKKKMSVINKPNYKGETPLHRACIEGKLSKVKELLQVPGIEVNTRDNAGWTPLHEACNHGNTEIVLELLKYRPAQTLHRYTTKERTHECRRVDLLAKSEEEGITPLHDAVQNNYIQVARLLLQYGGEALLDARCHDDRTPLDLAVSVEMRDLLENPPTHPLSAPVKRKHAKYSASSEETPESMLSQTSILSNTDTSGLHTGLGYQPKAEVYSEILDSSLSHSLTAGKYVEEEELRKYCVLVYHMITAYVQCADLIGPNVTRNLIGSHVGGVDSDEICKPGDLSNDKNCNDKIISVSNEPCVPRTNNCVQNTANNELISNPSSPEVNLLRTSRRNRKPKVIWSPSVNNNTNQAKRTDNNVDNHLLNTQIPKSWDQIQTVSGQNAENPLNNLKSQSPKKLSVNLVGEFESAQNSVLRDDVEILSELRTHVRAFHSHLRLIAQCGKLDVKCKIYLAALKFLQTPVSIL